MTARSSAVAPPVEHRVHWCDGSSVRLDVERWLAEPSDEELALLGAARGPVLDVGCGPGRHVIALRRMGVEALGIDVLPAALRVARNRGASVVERSIFDDVPRTGEWATALLLDGNVGIGGDPVALMRRVRAVLTPGGSALVELEGRGIGVVRADGRLETPHGRSARFAWGRVGIDGIQTLAARSGFDVADLRCADGRWFARVTAAPREPSAAPRRRRFRAGAALVPTPLRGRP